MDDFDYGIDPRDNGPREMDELDYAYAQGDDAYAAFVGAMHEAQALRRAEAEQAREPLPVCDDEVPF